MIMCRLYVVVDQMSPRSPRCERVPCDYAMCAPGRGHIFCDEPSLGTVSL